MVKACVYITFECFLEKEKLLKVFCLQHQNISFNGITIIVCALYLKGFDFDFLKVILFTALIIIFYCLILFILLSNTFIYNHGVFVMSQIYNIDYSNGIPGILRFIEYYL